MKKISKILGFVILCIMIFTPIFNIQLANMKEKELVNEKYNNNKLYFKLEEQYKNPNVEFAITKKQAEELNAIFGEGKVQLLTETYMMETVNISDNIYVNGLVNSQDVDVVENLNYIVGDKPQKPGDVVINEKLLEELKLSNDLDKINTSQVIKKYNYNVTGIYQNSKNAKINIEHNSDYISMDNAFFIKKTIENITEDEDTQDITQAAKDWNINQFYINNKLNDGKIVLNQETINDGIGGTYVDEVVDYKASIKAGAKGLVDPKTVKEIYGSKQLNVGAIELDSPKDLKKAKEEITKIIPEVVFPMENMGQNHFNKTYIIILILSVILLLLMTLKIQKVIKL